MQVKIAYFYDCLCHVSKALSQQISAVPDKTGAETKLKTNI
jgi:hypothetical protein